MFPCFLLDIISSTVLSFLWEVTSADMGRWLGSFTQTLAPIACISFVDPNPPSPLTVKVGCCCSVTKLCPTLCDHMDCSMPGFSVLHCLPEFAQTLPTELLMYSNCLILCHPLLLCPQSFPATGSFPKSQLFPSGAQSIGASASVLPLSIQGSFPLGLTGWFPCCLRDSQESFQSPQFNRINSSALSIL